MQWLKHIQLSNTKYKLCAITQRVVCICAKLNDNRQPGEHIQSWLISNLSLRIMLCDTSHTPPGNWTWFGEVKNGFRLIFWKQMTCLYLIVQATRYGSYATQWPVGFIFWLNPEIKKKCKDVAQEFIIVLPSWNKKQDTFNMANTSKSHYSCLNRCRMLCEITHS